MLSKRHVDREQPSARLGHARQRLPRAWRVDTGERDPGERRQPVHLVRLWVGVGVDGWGWCWRLGVRLGVIQACEGCTSTSVATSEWKPVASAARDRKQTTSVAPGTEPRPRRSSGCTSYVTTPAVRTGTR